MVIILVQPASDFLRIESKIRSKRWSHIVLMGNLATSFLVIVVDFRRLLQCTGRIVALDKILQVVNCFLYIVLFIFRFRLVNFVGFRWLMLRCIHLTHYLSIALALVVRWL